jgi:hypothetical protein
MRGTALLLLVACSGSGPVVTEPPVVPRPEPTTDSGTTETTDPIGGTFIDATYMAMIVRFGFDPVLGKAVEYANPGEGFSPLQLEVLLIDGAAPYVGLNDQNTCSVVLEFPGPIGEATWTKTYNAWFGFDVPAAPTVTDYCQYYSLPSIFQGDVAAQVTKWTWGAGVGQLSELMSETLENSLPDSEWAALQDYAVGGVLASNLFQLGDPPADFSDFGYGVAYEVDGNFEINLTGAGNPIAILADDVEQDVGIARAYYELQFGLFNGSAITAPVPGPF